MRGLTLIGQTIAWGEFHLMFLAGAAVAGPPTLPVPDVGEGVLDFGPFA